MTTKRTIFKNLREGQVFWFFKCDVSSPIYRWRKIGPAKAEDPDKRCGDCMVTPKHWVWVKRKG